MTLQQQKIIRQISGKDAHVLNLSDSLQDRIVQNASSAIMALQASKAKLMPTYEEKKLQLELAQQEFNEVAVQMENIDNEVKEQELLVQTMTQFMKLDKKDKALRVLAPAAEKKGTPAPKRIAWLDEAYKVLSEEGVFLSSKELVEKIVKQPHIQEIVKQMKSHISGTKTTAELNFISHAQITMRREDTWGRNFKPVLWIYKDMLGLYEWKGEDDIPLPPYMKQFMFKATG